MRLLAFLTVFLTVLLGGVSANVVTDSGALTSVDVLEQDDTTNWAGIYGEVSGVQAVGSQNTIFEWGSTEARYIYFSDEEINFTSNWTAGNKTLLKKQYEFLENKSDGVNTFNGTMDVDSVYQDQAVNGVPSTRTSNSSESPYWKTGYLRDDSHGFFVGEVKSGEAFDGSTANYQVLLPENGTDNSPTSYEVWVELVDS